MTSPDSREHHLGFDGVADPAREVHALVGGGAVGLFTSGLWRLRREVAAITGGRPERRWLGGRGLAAVLGWGHKATAARARRVAARGRLPYLAMEDGFLRSAAPGEPSLSYVCDAVGVYYDASGPSALEVCVRARTVDPARAARDAAPVLRAIRERGLSKVNAFDPDAPDLAALPSDPQDVVLVVDQTAGDASVTGAGADSRRFAAMLEAAAVENPGRMIVVRTHPEVAAGRRRGCLDLATALARGPAARRAAAEGRLIRLAARSSPAAAAARAGRVYAVSSLFGLEALIHGRPTTVFGQAFYSGWGLTDDRAPPTGRRGPASLEALVAAAYVDYPVYVTSTTREPCDVLDVIETLSRASR